ncbi:MAG: hypothetical protein QG599_2434 [Pseudomonadota bacterium]|nr:hypothetical protein [Pseudomonadota bacterium]
MTPMNTDNFQEDTQHKFTSFVDQNDPQTYAIIGAAMEVHRELGHGFLEAVYQQALSLEFTQRGIPHKREHPIPVFYKSNALSTPYRVDFLCYNAILVELKALSMIGGNEEAQVIHYLKATGLQKALLLNFGSSRLQYKRLILSQSYLRKSAASADNNHHETPL